MDHGLIDEQRVINTMGQTRANTIFTTGQPFGSSQKLFDAPKWMRVKLRLETAGPVTVGTTAELGTAIGSGAGASLGTDEIEMILKTGDSLYYVANAVNRFRMVTEPIPWAEQVFMRIGALLQILGAPKGPAPKKAPPKRPQRPNFGNVRGKRW